MSTQLIVSPVSQKKHYQDLVDTYGAPLLLLNCDDLRHQYQSLQKALPKVKLYYAVKSLPHPAVIETLSQLGAGFDIATAGEIDILEQLPVAPQRTIHTHPIKRDKDIRAALRFGCSTFVVDNIGEIEKFIPYKERVELILRISFRSPDAKVDLSKKFGCPPEQVNDLLVSARELGLHVKGLSFHVGSQSTQPDSHIKAINICCDIVEQQTTDNGHPFSIVDIGGGFPVQYQESIMTIEAFCQPIREALKRLPSNIQIIAEPGRYLSAPSVKAVSTVMGKAQRGSHTWYYLDDGIYGSYSGQLFDHVSYPIEIFSDSNEFHPSVLSGPTCDSIDVIAEDTQLPEMHNGEIIVGHQMGAYTAATATDFNSFERAKVVVINKQKSTVSRWSADID